MNRKYRRKIYIFSVISLFVIFSIIFFLIQNTFWRKNETGDKNKQEVVSYGNSQEKITEYHNSRYNYNIRYFDKWHINNEFSESEPEEIDLEERKILSGGQTFWSNYRNIDQYSPENKPEDFHLMNLTIYQDEKLKNEDALAEKLGIISDDWDYERIQFQAKNINGYEYVAPGVPGNPLIAIVFKKNDIFYVFRLAFVGGKDKIVSEMESMVATFELR